MYREFNKSLFCMYIYKTCFAYIREIFALIMRILQFLPNGFIHEFSYTENSIIGSKPLIELILSPP